MDLSKLLFIVVFSLSVLQVYSVPLEDLVTSAQARQLRSANDVIIETQLKNNPMPVLMPQNRELR